MRKPFDAKKHPRAAKDGTYLKTAGSSAPRLTTEERGHGQRWTVFVEGKLHARRTRRDALRLVPKGDRQLPRLVTL